VSEDSTSRKKPTWVDDKFKPVQAGQADDLNSLPGEFRAFRNEMRDCLNAIARSLQSLGRIEERIDVVIDRQNVLEQNFNSLTKRVAALETKPRARKKK
jgi:hypothetical protein